MLEEAGCFRGFGPRTTEIDKDLLGGCPILYQASMQALKLLKGSGLFINGLGCWHVGRRREPRCPSFLRMPQTTVVERHLRILPEHVTLPRQWFKQYNERRSREVRR